MTRKLLNSPIRDLIQQLGDHHERTRDDAINALLKIGSPAVPYLIESLQDLKYVPLSEARHVSEISRSQVRQWAAFILRMIDKVAAEAVSDFQLIDQPDLAARIAAITRFDLQLDEVLLPESPLVPQPPALERFRRECSPKLHHALMALAEIGETCERTGRMVFKQAAIARKCGMETPRFSELLDTLEEELDRYFTEWHGLASQNLFHRRKGQKPLLLPRGKLACTLAKQYRDWYCGNLTPDKAQNT